MTRLPQVLVNVPGVDKSRAGDDAPCAAAVAAAEADLGEHAAGCCCARRAPSRWCG